jgi:hypothetical protein
MELLSLLLIAGLNTSNLENNYPENIDYCVSIMYNPYLEQEFYKNCAFKQVNDYIMATQRN